MVISLPFPKLATLGLLGLVLVSPSFAEEPRAASPRAYRPITRPKVPEVRGSSRTDVDRFILASLEAKQLSLNPEAERTTLIRRVCFNLTGLPPTVAEIESFVSDRAPDAYERMMNRYLESPRYGERWGKIWLDAAGYADSNGYFNADSDRPLAWRYRDYVVRSFNLDKPYDRFVKEQLAGDELVKYVPGGDLTPEMVDAVTATHFLRNAPDGTGESDGNPDEVRIDRFTVLEGNIQNLMNGLLGITIQCARCHDHKFEPVTQEEYYGLQAILFPVYNPERWSKPNDRVVPIGTRIEVAEWNRRNDLISRQIAAAQSGLAAFAETLREQLIEERLKALDPSDRSAVVAAVKIAKDKRTAAQKALLKTHAKAIAIPDDELAKSFPEYAALRDRVKQTVAEREKNRPRPLAKLAAFIETDPSPAVHHLLRRGEHNSPGSEVSPGVPVSMCTPTNRYRLAPKANGQVSSGRRLALANWIASPENPLFARVMVNRIWQHYFGTGLVATSDNLGVSGSKPSHPELLDFLASEFISSGWSIKAMHRLILTSAVYRQSSAPKEGLEEIDPDNRLLAKFPIRRLDAEMVRDSILAISGELDVRAGGPYVPSQRTVEGVVVIEEKTAGAHRRSLYLQQRRTQVVTFLQLFDAPSIVSTCGKRSPSTVPLQSLTLLNSEFVRARSKSFADRLARECGADVPKRIHMAFNLTGGREPNEQELAACRKFLATQQKAYVMEKDPEPRAWTDMCQMLLSSNSFLYLE